MGKSKDPEVGLQLNTTGFVSSAKDAKAAIDNVANTKFTSLSKGIVNLAKDVGSSAASIGKGAAGGALAIGKGAQNLVGGALKGVGGLAKGIGGALAGGGISGISGAVGGGIGLIVGGPMGAAIGTAMASGAAKLFESSIGAAMKENRLNDRMEQIFGANTAILDETAEKIKTAFGFDDEDSKAAMNMLGQMGMGAVKTANSMSLVADIARAKNMSLSDSARLVGKAYQGSEGAARKLGIQIVKSGDPIKDQAAMMDQLQSKFGGAAATYAKNMPPFERLKLAVDDLMKSVGQKLIPIVVPFITWVADALTELISGEGFDSLVGSLVSGFKIAWGYAKEIGLTVIQMVATGWEVIKQLPTVIGGMWNSGKLMEWVTAMIGAIFKIVWDGCVLVGGLAKTAIMDGVPMIVGFLGKALTDMLRSTFGDYLSKKLGLTNASATFNEMMKGSGQNLAKHATDAFKDYGSKVATNLADIGSISRDAFSAGGIDFDAAAKKGKSVAQGLMGASDRTKTKIAKDTASLYGRTGKASTTIGMSDAGVATAQAKKQKEMAKQQAALRKAAGTLNARNSRGGAQQINVNVNLQNTDRMNPIASTVS